MSEIDIGTEKETITIEPVTEPVPNPEPAPSPDPVEVPEKVPAPETTKEEPVPV